MKTKNKKITLAVAAQLCVFFSFGRRTAHTHTHTTTMTGGQYDLDENLLDRAKHKPTLA